MRTLHFLRAISLFIFLSISGAVSGQATGKSPFQDTLVNDFCTAFSKASVRSLKENGAQELGLLILPLLSKYKTQIKTEWAMDIDNPQGMHKASEKIGQLAAIGCPAFLDFVKTNMNVQANAGGVSNVFTGKLIKVEGAPFSYLLVQNKAGKTDKIYWMEFFEGSDLINTKAGVPVNKAVSITYREVETYDAVRKEYRNIKVAARLQFN